MVIAPLRGAGVKIACACGGYCRRQGQSAWSSSLCLAVVASITVYVENFLIPLHCRYISNVIWCGPLRFVVSLSETVDGLCEVRWPIAIVSWTAGKNISLSSTLQKQMVFLRGGMRRRRGVNRGGSEVWIRFDACRVRTEEDNCK